MSKLESLEPARTVRMCLGVRQDELADWTLKSRKYRLRAFVKWYEESSVDDLIKLDGRGPYEFRVWKCKGNFGVEDGETPEEIAPAMSKSWPTTLRAFPQFTASTHAVPKGFYERVSLPKLSGTNDASDSALEPDRATDILKYLYCYHHVSQRHVEFTLLWETGVRMGTIHSLDLHGLDLDGQTPVARYKHRSDQGTPIKNGEKGEQFSLVSDQVGMMLQTYIDGPRVDKTDEFDRRPLLTTSHGQVSASTIQWGVCVVTRPCWPGQGCSHNRDVETYEAVELNHVNTCPSSRSPHDVRKGVVTLYRWKGVLRRVVSDRLDTSDLALDKHYNRRGERERTEQWRNRLLW